MTQQCWLKSESKKKINVFKRGSQVEPRVFFFCVCVCFKIPQRDRKKNQANIRPRFYFLIVIILDYFPPEDF